MPAISASSHPSIFFCLLPSAGGGCKKTMSKNRWESWAAGGWVDRKRRLAEGKTGGRTNRRREPANSIAPSTTARSQFANKLGATEANEDTATDIHTRTDKNTKEHKTRTSIQSTGGRALGRASSRPLAMSTVTTALRKERG